ncbi:glycosyltransferase family 4 protein [Micromonospora sagamiensis]|uniref:Glycosyltransferase involved in cell wall biosynthesis n=1 Tax=Micromonospora sagamiensis TaxID=47875 RepID=A0A562WET7_9ACTN|nr:glycosyltransferase family 4 protein [Micromonospora sagamiensis]TWJ28736.1 glycosyltransferase involved in cell wall biosynthesis [Micromonospora sagamiensis]BCL12357.1 glycosyl transferase family 1 [Micromonospora sagamiensis]
MNQQYDLTVALTYYTPYMSGVTHTAKTVAEGMAARGWRVAVVTSQHDRSTPRRETVNGVDVYRAPVLGQITRAQISPAYPLLAGQLARRSSLLHLNLPMAEGSVVARLAGRTPIVSMLHIDLYLPPGRLNRIAVAASDVTSRSALRRSAAVLAYSDDQAHHSKFWPLMREKIYRPIPSPCLDRRGGQPRYRRTGGLHVGFLGRIVEDKGIPYLVRAFRRIADPDARLLIGGNYQTVMGGANLDDIRAEIGADSRVQVLGELRGSEIDDFYASIDVFALPSVAESFGIVQAEAMMCGVPSVTTDLPGGRYPVLATQFGRVVPLRDPEALHQAIRELADAPEDWRETKAREARKLFGVERSLNEHEEVFTLVRDRTARRLR